ncbi:hypothetical protein [Vibrio splendidus]|uniref:hypothetical protein n=1 Tax=Vibrio splendidus TaxID=29497 RepID=UPI000D39EBB1|nr:hypothetical protein [Vibrio splendidus]PTP92703.1 hypothetical protein CWO02_12410 [Vibrio splendidus]
MSTIRNVIKKIVPRSIKNKLTEIKQKKKSLFMDDDFIQYVINKKKGIERHGSEVEILALRGSHADYAIFTDQNQNMYNLGLTSSDLYTSFQLYEKTKVFTPNLKYVVLFYSVFTPGLCLIKTKERNRLVTYCDVFGFDYQENDIINRKDEKIILKKINKKTNQKCNIPENFRGYVNPSHFTTNITPEVRVKTHIRENKREPNQLKHLEKLSRSITSDGKKLIIVLSPNRSDYKSLLKEDRNLFTSLSNSRLKNVEIFDFYNSDLFEDSDFGDTDHLNLQGAKKLTKELSRKIELLDNQFDESLS